MRASTEEFLYFLLWTADTFMRPTWYNFTDSFEGWAFRNGLGRRIQQLEAQKLVERQHPTKPAVGKGFFRITAEGRLRALGGRDPVQQWQRSWDGRWRLLVFDLPAKEVALRTRLRRYLTNQSFGYLQNSVWITPDSLHDAARILHGYRESVESLTLFDGRPCDGASDAELVEGAWNFTVINERYAEHRRTVAQCPLASPPRSPSERARVCAWAQRERTAWKRAFVLDPLLPAPLLPAGYLGRKAWEERWAAFRRLVTT